MHLQTWQSTDQKNDELNNFKRKNIFWAIINFECVKIFEVVCTAVFAMEVFVQAACRDTLFIHIVCWFIKQ